MKNLLRPAWVLTGAGYCIAAGVGHVLTRISDANPSGLTVSNMRSEMNFTAARLDRIEKEMATRFDRVDGRLDKIEGSMDSINASLNYLNARFTALKKSLNKK